ncbi:MAG: SUF system NifU family Fe-S cluster assembly protein [Candidatus Kapabacteria bacterium]|nr:SUF system NifU family Fe-S cluster assembly protein [Ignavibacteriota bacterium]MCW5885127.1 SUF system NifU family Fe-S cluster assembly protein [Candidatus Kapabacteria bacterium]
MNELRELYQQVILDHNKNPRNFGELKQCTNYAAGHNPLCGDQIDVFAVLDGGVVKDLKFNGSGCAISKASASIMTTLVVGKTIDEAKGLFNEFHKIVTSDMSVQLDTLELGKMAVFCGVREFPARVKCASLAWHTMIQALENSNKVAITETNLN